MNINILLSIVAVSSVVTMLLVAVLVQKTDVHVEIQDSVVLMQEDATTTPYTEYLAEVTCLAKNIYFEARGEPLRGQIAVAHVTMNRVNSDMFPDTVCGVVTQGPINQWVLEQQHREVPVLHKCQFSWYCDGKSDTPRNNTSWNRARQLAVNVLTDQVPDVTQGAKWFHHTSVDPGWDRLHPVTTIGNHVFYQLAD